MLRWRWRPVATCLSTAAIAVSACGAHPASRQDVIARGNAICARALQDIRAVPAPAGGSGSLGALSPYLRQVALIVQKEARQLQALPKPAKARPLLERYLSAVAADAHQYQELAAAARADDAARASQALANVRASQAASLATQYGLSQCAAPGSTAVS